MTWYGAANGALWEQWMLLTTEPSPSLANTAFCLSIPQCTGTKLLTSSGSYVQRVQVWYYEYLCMNSSAHYCLNSLWSTNLQSLCCPIYFSPLLMNLLLCIRNRSLIQSHRDFSFLNIPGAAGSRARLCSKELKPRFPSQCLLEMKQLPSLMYWLLTLTQSQPVPAGVVRGPSGSTTAPGCLPFGNFFFSSPPPFLSSSIEVLNFEFELVQIQVAVIFKIVEVDCLDCSMNEGDFESRVTGWQGLWEHLRQKWQAYQ